MIGHHRRDTTPQHRRNIHSMAGAILVELAIVSLFLVTLSAGAWDYGMAWRAGLGVNEAARTGARVGSATGTDVEADFSLLTGSRSALLSAGQLNDVERVVIFQSNTVDGDVPTQCKTAMSTAEKCNILTGAQFRAIPASSSGALNAKGCIAASTVRNWCPADRENVQLVADYLGIWIKVKHGNDFRLASASSTIERRAVMRLEPKES